MTETTKYLECLREIETFCESNKIEISENIISTIIGQVGIDFRLKRDSIKSETKEPIKQEITLATEPQKELLTKLKIKFDKDISKQEAWQIINTHNKKEQEY